MQIREGIPTFHPPTHTPRIHKYMQVSHVEMMNICRFNETTKVCRSLLKLKLVFCLLLDIFQYRKYAMTQ